MQGLIPDGVILEKNLLIPMRDGIHLAADLYRPADEGPFPTLISIYPYHKDDIFGAEMIYYFCYFALQGYAHLFVDCRGLGSSEGVAWSRTGQGEARDGADAVEWAARQPWSDGNVGMWGLSYGAFMTLETASHRPPHLKAIAPIIGAADGYHDNTYAGGCLNCMMSFGEWGPDMVASNLMPPGYQDPQGRWYQVWQDRLQNPVIYMLEWQGHPRYDDHWKQGVIPVEHINVPTFAIGGWADLFADAMPRIYSQIPAPKKLVMGPWPHLAPDQSPVEPWGFCAELTRWWDHWLRGMDSGIMEEPPVTLYVQNAAFWRHEREWPLERSQEMQLYLANEGRLAHRAEGEGKPVSYRANPTVGTAAYLRGPVMNPRRTPPDQNQDDLLSLTFTTEPLKQDLEITGSPEAELHVELVSGTELNLVAKLNHVAPDGSSTMITRGWLKGSHYRSHEAPEPLQAGQGYAMRISLRATSYLIPEGHRLRLSISCSDFPQIWPTATNPVLRLHLGGEQASSIRLPVTPLQAPALPAPNIRRPDPAVNHHPALLDGSVRWKVERDLVENAVTVRTGSEVAFEMPRGARVKSWKQEAQASVVAERPESARVESQTRILLSAAAGEAELEARTVSTHDRVLVTARVSLNGVAFFEEEWTA